MKRTDQILSAEARGIGSLAPPRSRFGLLASPRKSRCNRLGMEVKRWRVLRADCSVHFGWI
ncbi:MAG: hypothetical protein EAZ21_10830 [Betaproteobacteria bacterium]|nr:MAG: hypothetical protein EAZ21_10830 [Betaproteobacteria bacterium]